MPNIKAVTDRLNPFQQDNHLSDRYDMTAPDPQLGSIYTRDADREPAPIVSLSVGSAGMHRTALWVQKMNALGCLNRIQSLIVYDCNSTNIRLWKKAAEASGLQDISIVPEYLPLSEGFLRQPDFFMDHYGAIERDIERIVDDMERQANEAGTRPQVILEWIGFGGHARLSYLIHEHVADRFPRAKFLPIYCMPAERVLEQNIRQHHLWDEAEHIIGKIPSLITDNRASGSLQTLDERVALGLASMEACYRFRPEAGTMAETVSMFNIKGVRWLSLEVADVPYRVNKPSRSRNRRPPTHDQRMSHSAVVQSIKEAIWRIASPLNDEQHTAYFRTPPDEAEQRIYCIIPYTHEIVDEIKEDVEDQLQRETFTGPYPGTKVCFASGNAQWRPDQQKFHYGHIFKITGMSEDLLPQSIERVINDQGNFRNHRRRVMSKGERMMIDRGLTLSDHFEKQTAPTKPMFTADNASLIPRSNGSQPGPEERLPSPEERLPSPEERLPDHQFEHRDLGQGVAPVIDPADDEIVPA